VAVFDFQGVSVFAEAVEGFLRKAGFQVELVRQVLVVEARRVNGLLNI